MSTHGKSLRGNSTRETKTTRNVAKNSGFAVGPRSSTSTTTRKLVPNARSRLRRRCAAALRSSCRSGTIRVVKSQRLDRRMSCLSFTTMKRGGTECQGLWLESITRDGHAARKPVLVAYDSSIDTFRFAATSGPSA